ncbi:DUF2157 domain-containing protein [Catelliglobosispora koreensis]|uniref:DUF2157 domain-containing protein n=1 Tax=Catelliglobosispora koreensis TaxID=129052 RepID=UPI0003697AC8|nr:DUF2157 domain-containing protein [Catelliglobosispora koreensis]
MSELSSLVGQWVSRGIISEQQGQQILAEHKQPLRVSISRGSLIAEALAYVGGILILLAAIIIASLYWPDLVLAAKSGLTGGSAAIVLIAGFLLPASMGAARGRLRSVLWALSVALLGIAVGITLDGLHWNDETGVFAAAAAAAALAAPLWLYHKSFLQQTALGVSLVLAVGSAAAHLPNDRESTIGLAIWGLGLAWLALTWGALITPQRTGYLLGGAAIVAGSQLTTQLDWGLALAGASVLALLAAAVYVRDLWLLGVGAVGVLVTVPLIVDRFFEGELAAPLALLGAGVLLIGLGVFTARKRGGAEAKQRAEHRIPAAYAIGLAVAVAAVMTVVVLLAGRAW